MKEWTQEQIDEARTFGWKLYNKDGKSMVDCTCFKCDTKFQHESAEEDMLAMYCPKCFDKWIEKGM